jgi:anthranilate synthase component 1
MPMATYRPTAEAFATLAGAGNTIPVYRRLLSDHLTPVTAFARVAETTEHAFLLESVVGGEKIARYSFIGADPTALFEATRTAVTITRDGAAETSTHDDPLEALEALLAGYRAVHLPELPRFAGGAVGYAGYDMVRYVEHLPDAPPDDRGLPDLLFGIYDRMVIFDHVSKTVNVVAHAHVDRDGVEGGYRNACAGIDEIVAALSKPSDGSAPTVDLAAEPSLNFESQFQRTDFEAAVDKCKEYIRAGDIFQVVLSQRLHRDTRANPFDIYRMLRVVNPSPFMFYLTSPQVILVGASPEIMCRVEDGVVTNRPLAGTRRRGHDAQEDLDLERELLADPKERAEHVMLVDLGRNDVGRVAQIGSVELSDLMTVERYSHVMHISSNVTGRLDPDKTAFDALRAALPVGTVSGAPKVRAMQIIDELEPTRRGPYAGAVGNIDFAGNLDTCIALRTMVITGTDPPDDDARRVYIQVGAGIVADSVPANEYQETINKAKGMLKAVELAEGAF